MRDDMKIINHHTVLLLIFFFLSCNCAEKTAPDNTKKKLEPVKVTFVELGSVNCIPCKAMQPVMKAVEEEYGDQVQVIFHDVWKDPEPGRKYGIRLIPTQVFLDEKGVEFHRHEGFYSKEEIDIVLQSRGLKSLKKGNKT
jgi:thioredoxin 1